MVNWPVNLFAYSFKEIKKRQDKKRNIKRKMFHTNDE